MKNLYDLFIIGGGINGAGIARDAAGRGLKVCLVDKGLVGSATSSWSSKLIHGGLRYLENYEFKLVRESLIEREVIKRIASEITKTIPFIIPYNSQIRSKLLIKIGLALYDNLGGKTSIPKSSTINLNENYQGILKNEYSVGFKYYDLQVDDKKLTEMNVADAKKNDAVIFENTKVISASRNKNNWIIKLNNNKIIESKILINASGPWINDVIKNVIKIPSKKDIRLIKGSHIITKKLYDHQVAFTLQNFDKRIIFVIPYKKDFSLIGTTEVEVENPNNPSINNAEIEYLIKCINSYFKEKIDKKNIVETYSGIRPLIEDFKEVSKITRDYAFDLNNDNDLPPLLNIFGGKLTTYRKLAEKVLYELNEFLPVNTKKTWTNSRKLF